MKILPGQTVTVVIYTLGVPTDKKGGTSRDIQRNFLNAIKKLSKLPVKIVVRLCTGDESVCGNNIDVLDDYWGEVC